MEEEKTVENQKEQQEDTLILLLKNSKKQLFYAKVRTFAVSIVAAVALICALILLPRVEAAITKANGIMEQATETITLANEAIAGITTMSDSITDMGTNMDTFITDNSESVEAVMTKLEEIDFEGLNSAIKDLGDVVEPLANFFNVFN